MDTREVVLAYVAALNAHDVAAACALVAEDFHNEHTSSLGSSLRGRDAYRERLPGFLGAFAGLRYEPEAVIVEGERAAAPYVLTATVTDDGGRPRPIRIRGCFVFRVVDGEIVHRLDYWDAADYRSQTS